MKKNNVPKKILERVEAELLREEELLWVGQPHPTRFLMASTNKTHPVLAMAIGLEIALMIMTAFASFLAIAGFMFLALILTTIFGSIWQQIHFAQNTIYAITNQRALTICGGEVETFGKNDLQSIVKKTQSNGIGDIIFRKDTEQRIIPSTFGLMLHRQEVRERGFFGIENPQQVELLLLDTFSVKAIDTSRLEDRDAFSMRQSYQGEYQVAEEQR